VASERQISANRRNALKSTGPKSRAGKKRAASNSLRHGLSITSVPECEAVESLARRIAGDIASDAVLGHARAAARAHTHLAGIRALETEIINRTFLFGTLELRVRYRSTTAEIRYIKMQLKTGQPFSLPPRIDPLGPMPSEEAERMDEALRRSLPALRNLYRYERRAITQRDRALSEISAILKRERSKLEGRTRFCKTKPI
jgi:hypothetical protein